MGQQSSEVIEVKHPQKDSPLGWVVVDSVSNDLSFGGCRMKPDVTLPEVRELAQAMTWKLFCHGQPTGGAKAGIRIDPQQDDALALMEHFGREVSDVLSTRVVLGKDMGATDALMEHLYASAGVSQLAPLGPMDLSWLREFRGYRRHMTGLGISMATSEALGAERLDGLRVGIQGAGVVGVGAAVRLSGLGASIVAMSDAHRCIRWDNGVSVAELEEKAGSTRDLSAMAGSAIGSREALFEQHADVIVLAASSYSVSSENVEAISAPLVVEGANMAFQVGGRALAFERGLMVVPDVIASSSSAGMVCSQLARKGAWEDGVLWERLRTGISEAVSLSAKVAQHKGITLRKAHILRCGMESP
jgi:glutamate dehydrogenase (NAD(P)+)